MQLIIGVRGCWKYVEVALVDGCVPSVGGREVDGQNIEPALWFKVLVLENACIDCSDRVISWSVKGSLDQGPTPSPPSTHVVKGSLDQGPTPNAHSTIGESDRLNTSVASVHSILSNPTLSPIRGASVAPSNHSLMAPHEGEASSCTDDLQSLFELAEVLYRVNKPSSSPRTSRAASVESRSWVRLLHCYLLPLVTLHHEDLVGVEMAHTTQTKLLESLDKKMLDTSEQSMKLKEKLSLLRQQLLPRVKAWAEHGRCSHKFLAILTSDLQITEDNARAMIHSSQRNLDLLTSPLSSDLAEKFRADLIKGENLLVSSLELRSDLEGLMSTLDLGRGTAYQKEEDQEGWALQQAYIKLHSQLAAHRAKSADLSRKKVLALSVREALEQTMFSLQRGRSTTGIDRGLQGGHSTDVLPGAHHQDTSDEYLTLRDKIERLLRHPSSLVAKQHREFCQEIKSTWSQSRLEKEGQKSLTDLQELVKSHFQQMVDEICRHFNNHQLDFSQRTWLCYEGMFFELFNSDFMNIYQAHHSKQCEQLTVNALSVSVMEPQHLNLHVDPASLHLFPPRPFQDAVTLHQLTDSTLDHSSEEFREYFGGVVSDITFLSSAISPLDRLQLLTSAFRKLMASLSRIKLAPLVAQSLEEGTETIDLSMAAVSCDEMLPMLVLVLLQLKPTLLSALHVHCCFLSDYIAPFLSSGWHGYSLAAFSSALHILGKL